MLFSITLMAGKHSYAEHSVLAEGKWVKIRVSESGVCKMTFSQLRSAGLDPQQLRVFGYGGAMLNQDFREDKIDDLPQVPVYTGDNYVLFYVQGPISWRYDSDYARFIHSRNTYSDYGYYLLTDNVGELMPLPMAQAVTGNATDISIYPAYQVHEKDSLNLIDRTGVSGGGRDFYGEQFNAGQSRTFTLSTPNAVTTEASKAYIDLAGYANVVTSFRSDFNGVAASTSINAYKDFYTFGCAGTINTTASSQADKQTIKLTYQSSLAGAFGWLNYIELTSPTALRMTGAYMPVRTDRNVKSSTPVRFLLSDASEAIQVWDVTRLDAIQQVPATLSGTTLQWTGSQANGVREYVAVNPQGSKWVSAQVVGNIANQDLHNLRNIDYVIICPEGYEALSEQLARAHEEKEAITWAVVTDQQVYNEFSSGTPDATAYRWLMKMLYDRADGNGNAKPRWLLLMGHGTFDNRKLLPNSGVSLLLTYQSKNSLNEVNAYASDDYFGWLDDNEGASDTAAKMDIGVGRLPATSVAEAQATVDKIIRYMRNENPGKWKNQLVYLADDGENGTHTETSEISAERIRVNNPDFVIHKIFLDAYPQEVNASGESYPLAKNRVTNLLKSGLLFFDYSGHGGYNAITNESILNLKDIENMRNTNLGFWLFATCNFAQFDGGKRCAAEASVLNPNGGAVGILAATRTVYASQNNNLNRAVCDELFAHNGVRYEATLGEAIAAGKNQLGNDMNKLPYVLFGDPALRLNYPTDYSVSTTTAIDTLHALSVQHVEGRIVDEDDQTVEDFNGTVDVTVYDKLQSIPTRDNDQVDGEERVVAYNDYPSTIFSGKTEVKDGLFNYTFMVPKDIRYNYGNGRIVYYARTADSLETAEAVGHFEDFIVGGSGKNSLLADTTGPEMFIYLNTPAFRDGGKTYATPRFFAELSDSSGINTAGAGIGHDLLLVIDDDAKQTYSLNEYFTAADNSYQAGQVSYLMEALPNGSHSLSFRAWDLLNNSTTQTLNFIVEAGLDPSICSVTTYPNPVMSAGMVTMAIQYDQPDELLTTELYLYSPSGQLIWHHSQSNPDRVNIPIGQLGLTPGVYVYTVKIKSATSGYSSSPGRIIVTK